MAKAVTGLDQLPGRFIDHRRLKRSSFEALRLSE
jgi:hypothetical protein